MSKWAGVERSRVKQSLRVEVSEVEWIGVECSRVNEWSGVEWSEVKWRVE